jgi:hypothetical protein
MRRFRFVLLAIAGAVAAVALGAAPAPAAAGVSVFPSPGTKYNLPGTQITFRGISPGNIGHIQVVGSKTGTHSGHIADDSDGNGGSFLPDEPFAAGETVTVNTNLSVVGASQGDFQFRIATPAGPIRNRPVAHVSGPTQHFHSRPDLRPSTVQVLRQGAFRQGDIFVAPQYGPTQDGPMILDPSGHLIWFYPVPNGQLATDFRMQTLHNEPVLTWWQGYMNNGSGRGSDIIFDRDYREVAAVKAGNGLQGSDLHEFLLTNSGDAYISAVSPLRWPGTSKPLMDSVVQEIDVKTGLVLYEWHAADHIPISSSFFKTPHHPGHVWDPYHLNSISIDHDGNLVISLRNTWGVYKIDHSSGRVIWTLGTGHSSFKMGRGTRTAFQHDAVVQRDGTITVFDDGAGPPRKESQSRAIRIALNTKTMTASLAKQYTHNPKISSNYEGGAQPLAFNDMFVGWGQPPYFTEFNSKGQIDFDARFASRTDSYRAYRFHWSAQPPTTPAIAISHGSHGVTTGYASWNGANDVEAWRLLGGSSPSDLQPLRIVKKTSFETSIEVHSRAKYFKVQALAAKSKILASSETIS